MIDYRDVLLEEAIRYADFPPLTRRETEVYVFIVTFAEDNGYFPSYKTIADAMGIKSLKMVWKLVNNLANKRYLKTKFYGRVTE